MQTDTIAKPNSSADKADKLAGLSVPQLKRMKAHASDLLERIDAELQQRSDNAGPDEAGKMNDAQFSRWSQKMMQAGD